MPPTKNKPINPENILVREISPKQREFVALWEDQTTTEMVYGGAAGGGKSKLFAMLIVKMATIYPGSRGLIGRESLKDLKATTLLTIFEELAGCNFKEGKDYEYNEQSSQIRWWNGSILFLVDLGYYPSDPNYDRLGGYEVTYAMIEEGQQVEKKAKDAVASRIRYKIDEFGLIPKLGVTCNPGNNWIKQDFYKPFREGTLPAFRAFVPALPTDNPWLSKLYIEQLRRLPPSDRERLLFGNWDYDDDPMRMMSYDAITDIFSNKIDPLPKENFIICDVARFGSDLTVIAYFEGMVLQEIKAYRKLSTVQTYQMLEHWRTDKKVPKSFTLVDEGGIGGGVIDQGGYKGFMGGRSAYDKRFQNLNAECQFKLAEVVNGRQMLIKTESEKIRQLIVEDLEQVRRKDADKDGKIQVVAKDKRKERLGRSPDCGDVLMMRMWFEVVPKPTMTSL